MFKKNIKILGLLLAIIGGLGAIIYAGPLTLEVIGGPLTTSADEATTINIDINYSANTGTIELSIATGTFAVEDLYGLSGYYTTIQITNLNQNGGTGTIPTSYIKFKAGPIITITGSNNPSVQIGSAINEVYGDIGKPKVYFYKNQGANTGLIGKYSDFPTLKITVPPYTPTGTYKGNIYYIFNTY